MASSHILSAVLLSLMVSFTKDKSLDMHVDGPLEGFLGPILWYPEWAAPLLGREYIVRDPIFADRHKTSPLPEHLIGFNDAYIRDGSAGALLVRLCYLAAGVSVPEYRVVNFNVRSTRHLFPNVACALQWSPDNCNETG